jgi:protein subunit release factor A
MTQEALNHLETIEERLAELELRVLLQDPVDQGGAYLNLQAGAGGVDAMDWTAMLLRMYLRWTMNRGYKGKGRRREDMVRVKKTRETQTFFFQLNQWKL